MRQPGDLKEDDCTVLQWERKGGDAATCLKGIPKAANTVPAADNSHLGKLHFIKSSLSSMICFKHSVLDLVPWMDFTKFMNPQKVCMNLHVSAVHFLEIPEFMEISKQYVFPK